MSWIKDTATAIRDASTAEPFRCPRGWGDVTFQLSFSGFLPAFDVSRKCPIGGVEKCTKCRHPHSPESSALLRENLEELDVLRQEGVLTKEEHAARRKMLVGLYEVQLAPPGHGFRIAAWILGPIGVVVTTVGLVLADRFHEGFWALAIAGVLVLGLCLSFAVLGRSRARDGAERKPDRYG